MRYEAILFDCDGTLVDTEPLQNLACAQLLNEQGLAPFTQEEVARRFTGIRFSDMLEIISAETGHVFPGSLRGRYVERVKELSPAHFRTMEGAEELVAEAHRHCKIAVVSNGQRDNVFLSLDLAGLRKYFPDDLVFSGLMAKAKPAPDLYLLAARTLGVAPGKCLAVEDSVPGVTAAAAAGMDVFGFTQTHEERLLEAGARQVYRSLQRIRGQILFLQK